MTFKILVVDDDREILGVLTDMLGSEYEVVTASTGTEGINAALSQLPDLVVLDLCLKDGCGIKICEQLRSNSLTRHIPVLMLTGFGELTNKIGAFSAGADEFIEKPIVADEIRARIKSKLRRIAETGKKDQLTCGNLILNPERFEATVNGKKVQFSVLEYKLLSLFVINKNKILDRQEILQSIWGDVSVSERTIDAHLVSIRKKLADFDHELRSVYGAGFILRERRH